MDQININAVESFFATVGSHIYEVAEKTVKEFSIDEYIHSGVLVGLSGGADSVLLLCFLLEYRRRNHLDFTICASHINHGIRGDEADSDEEFCRRLCESLGVELLVDKYSIPQIAERFKMSIEEAARWRRYASFDRIIHGRSDVRCVAVAHNMSDNAETVVFNILRGSGARGAAGIRPIRDNIVRPLIRISKKDIQTAMDEGGIPYVTDSTNLCDDYTRNYIRHEIIPSFDRIVSDPERMISRFSENMRSDDDFIYGVAEEFISSHKPVRNSDLKALHYSVFVRALVLMAESARASISYRIASDIHSLLCKDNFSYSIIGNASFVCERGECRISRDTTEGQEFCYEVCEGITDLSPLNAIFILSNGKKAETFSNVYKNSIQANLSSAIINGNLYLRSKKDGDTVYYGGMTHKIKKLFSDAKIPRSKRSLIPILCDESGVVWVPGFGVRDDGVQLEEQQDIFVTLAINEDVPDDERLYSGSEFRNKKV